MYDFLLKIKEAYLILKEYYYSIVLIEKKKLYYYHQTINYMEQNVYGLIHNLVSSLWLLILFFFLLNDVKFFYLILFILIFGAIFYLMVTYFSNLVPKTFLNWLLSLSYFYKVEAELMNIIIYILFLLALSLSFFFSIKTYVFIRLLFFFRCFLSFIFIFYQSLPNLQIELLKNCLITDLKLLDDLHPMEKINIDNFIKLKLNNNEINRDQAFKLLERYKKLEKEFKFEASIKYNRTVQNGQIITSDFKNVFENLTNVLDRVEQEMLSGSIKNSNIIELKKNEEK